MKMSWIRRIELNGKHIKSLDEFHDEIEGFANTDGYGRNLDALYDELSQSSDLIVFENVEAFKRNLAGDGERILKVIRDADEDNDMLTVVFK